jgi:hypothetical protein
MAVGHDAPHDLVLRRLGRDGLPDVRPGRDVMLAQHS